MQRHRLCGVTAMQGRYIGVRIDYPRKSARPPAGEFRWELATPGRPCY